MEEGSRQSFQPTPEELAHRLVGYEAEGSRGPEALIAKAEKAFDRLHTTLSVFLGSKGFESLWARAMLLAQQTLQAEGLEEGTALFTSPERWADAAGTRDAAQAHIILHAQFASFLSLLFTFIGEEIGLRLIRPALPDIPPHEEDSPTEDARL
ncbi:MAG: hypothetical protein H0T73_21610 [Ardenticatenales bacterium]|nr:hypothetical protein [Ardenticatenales bacterium]